MTRIRSCAAPTVERDAENPYYETEAPESGDGPLRLERAERKREAELMEGVFGI